MAASFCIPSSNVWEFSSFHILARICCHSVPDFGHSNRCVVISVVTVASWPVYRFLRRQVRSSGTAIFLRIFKEFSSLLWSMLSKALVSSIKQNASIKIYSHVPSVSKNFSYMVWFGFSSYYWHLLLQAQKPRDREVKWSKWQADCMTLDSWRSYYFNESKLKTGLNYRAF